MAHLYGSLARQLRTEPQLIPGSDWLSQRGGYLFAPVEELREATPEERAKARHPAWSTHQDKTGKIRKRFWAAAGLCRECGKELKGEDAEFARCWLCRHQQQLQYARKRMAEREAEQDIQKHSDEACQIKA